MLMHSLQRRVVENQLVLKGVYFQDSFLAVEVTERPFLQKVGTELANPWTRMQIKHEVTTLADMSSLGGCEMQWMSQDEGSDR